MARILFIADVIGAPGFKLLVRFLPSLISESGCDLVVANGENGLDGRGFSTELANKYRALGIDVVTGGNHIFDKKAFRKGITATPWVLRPLNFPPGVEGGGWGVFSSKCGYPIGVVSLQGRSYLPPIDCPFRTLEVVLPELKEKTEIIFVDFHAEATAEKQALARCFDGRVSAVIGTHTHVQTADETILPGGTGYQTDAGMTGPIESVIGNAIEPSIEKHLLQIPVPQVVASGPGRLQGVLLDIENSTGRCLSIQRINRS